VLRSARKPRHGFVSKNRTQIHGRKERGFGRALCVLCPSTCRRGVAAWEAEAGPLTEKELAEGLARARELAPAYEDAFLSWDDSSDAAEWDVTSADNL